MLFEPSVLLAKFDVEEAFGAAPDPLAVPVPNP